MTFDNILSSIGAVGFPIVVAWYCLTKLQTTIEKNTESNNRVALMLSLVCSKIGIDASGGK